MKRLLIPILLCLAAFASSAQSQRERVNFDKGWQFAFGDASSPAKDFGCGTEYFNYFTKIHDSNFITKILFSLSFSTYLI